MREFQGQRTKKTHHTAHFYNDFLYVIGGINMGEESDEENELEGSPEQRKEKQKNIWRFDISNCILIFV